MMTKEEASKKACELLRKHFINEDNPKLATYDDDTVIEIFTDEWSWFMQGWQEAIKTIKK